MLNNFFQVISVTFEDPRTRKNQDTSNNKQTKNNRVYLVHKQPEINELSLPKPQTSAAHIRGFIKNDTCAFGYKLQMKVGKFSEAQLIISNSEKK